MAPQMMVLTLTHEVTFEPCTHAQIERDADYVTNSLMDCKVVRARCAEDGGRLSASLLNGEQGPMLGTF